MATDIFQTEMYYHVTSFSNINSIIASGIDPAYSKGRIHACWWVGKDKITWAILHVSNRHNLPVGDIAICVARISKSDLRRTNKRDVYYCPIVIHADTVSPANWFIDSEVS